MTIRELQENFSQPGRVTFICVRSERLQPVTALEEVFAIQGRGLEGDRHSSTGPRQVTLIQEEHLKTVSSLLGKEINPQLVRRNIVVSGINLLALKGKQFRIGEAILEYSGECHPCSRMETNLGLGGYNAMRGHGGITARIIKSGLIKINDAVTYLI